jgi:DNA-binding IclR family transcriptional regulator
VLWKRALEIAFERSASLGLPLAAISVSGPTSRILHAETAVLAALLREHAQQVSKALA